MMGIHVIFSLPIEQIKIKIPDKGRDYLLQMHVALVTELIVFLRYDSLRTHSLIFISRLHQKSFQRHQIGHL
ncbi:hypothetical protein JHK82_022303 [Glycine max]|uniref:Uncharacterized protein n=2 Tax=Glycine subgen. Soja TaxID=1462606 RepID=A0A0R0IXE9_SOYBN|nr:hypothetical protein JHK85_022790 [Glycine max]RZB98605.1 hypothetical protein D0Y65_021489 [Glycine soja]KAG5026412.1 hypothetical protein JHK86_022326 [Glycine max]KAG5137572.1 hypothetical protein JHK82_022303 [Glycine max]KAH1052892.1 hypothetical protein GYH30_022261 [Glycine max]